jgi:hypothetical protein
VNAARLSQQQHHWHRAKVIKWFLWFADNRVQQLAKLAAIVPLWGGTPHRQLCQKSGPFSRRRRYRIGNDLAILAKMDHCRQNCHLNFTQPSALLFTAAIAAAVFILPPPPFKHSALQRPFSTQAVA